MKNYKVVIFVILCVFRCHNCLSQKTTIDFYFDDSGNRIQRNCIILSERSIILKDSIVDLKPEYSFTLFPNITEGVLNVRAEDKFFKLDFRKISIYDINGKRIQTIDFNSKLEIINLENYSTGTYIVQVTANGGYYADWRIIKK